MIDKEWPGDEACTLVKEWIKSEKEMMEKSGLVWEDAVLDHLVLVFHQNHDWKASSYFTPTKGAEISFLDQDVKFVVFKDLKVKREILYNDHRDIHHEDFFDWLAERFQELGSSPEYQWSFLENKISLINGNLTEDRQVIRSE